MKQTGKQTPTFFHRDTVRLTPMAQKNDVYTMWLKRGTDTIGVVLCSDRDGTVLVDFTPKVMKSLSVCADGIGIMSSTCEGVIWVSRHDLEKVEV